MLGKAFSAMAKNQVALEEVALVNGERAQRGAGLRLRSVQTRDSGFTLDQRHQKNASARKAFRVGAARPARTSYAGMDIVDRCINPWQREQLSKTP